ncbi:MAG: GNAT family N-acetyltransferase [Xanthomonadaceae bacterium]|nr:GNAT family N-acetyltransferase [Xanthomonadaceae bacterium]MBU6477431.1 GNAT family N-acetyltransferase [Xanthomonadaceae bacterium]MDE2054081.1 GNAT family N-acetyltransferase [Xanthomonadaceae bacterium]
MPIVIRTAEVADVAFLVECNAAMALETEHKTLDRDVLTRGTQAVFDDPRRGFYLIAELDGDPAGCLLITFEWSDWRNGDWWWFQSVYVTKTARRAGVFRALYADVEHRARAAGAVGLRLYVERDNERAQQTYVSLGMEEEAYKMLRRGFIHFV